MDDAIAQLGGRCVRCGTTSDLDFDHIDPTTKIFEISDGWKKPQALLQAELAKCQLLCRPCHIVKTRHDPGRGVDHGGGASGKRNCKCDLCRARKNEWQRNWKRRRADLRKQESPKIFRQMV